MGERKKNIWIAHHVGVIELLEVLMLCIFRGRASLFISHPVQSCSSVSDRLSRVVLIYSVSGSQEILTSRFTFSAIFFISPGA